eukprot:2478403-Prymnesium_polylepis.1
MAFAARRMPAAHVQSTVVFRRMRRRGELSKGVRVCQARETVWARVRGGGCSAHVAAPRVSDTTVTLTDSDQCRQCASAASHTSRITNTYSRYGAVTVERCEAALCVCLADLAENLCGVDRWLVGALTLSINAPGPSLGGGAAPVPCADLRGGCGLRPLDSWRFW